MLLQWRKLVTPGLLLEFSAAEQALRTVLHIRPQGSNLLLECPYVPALEDGNHILDGLRKQLSREGLRWLHGKTLLWRSIAPSSLGNSVSEWIGGQKRFRAEPRCNASQLRQHLSEERLLPEWPLKVSLDRLGMRSAHPAGYRLDCLRSPTIDEPHRSRMGRIVKSVVLASLAGERDRRAIHAAQSGEQLKLSLQPCWRLDHPDVIRSVVSKLLKLG